MTKHTLFIADLHLSPFTPRINQNFLNFLQQRAIFADKLYILGDLFEVWLGDDEEGYESIKAALRTVTASGVEINILPGNRDFLLGTQFEMDTGCRILAEPQIIDLYGFPVILMHGDVLCTRDVAYQAFRQQVRDERWQQQFLAQPLAQRRILAQQARQHSQQHAQETHEYIMDVTPEEVDKVMRSAQVYELIHGHTHRSAVHVEELDGKTAKRYVLGAWQPEQAVIVQATSHSMRLFDWLAEEESI